jgi:hypothetical protein
VPAGVGFVSFATALHQLRYRNTGSADSRVMFGAEERVRAKKFRSRLIDHGDCLSTLKIKGEHSRERAMTDQARITLWRFKAEELRTLSDVMKVQEAREAMAQVAKQWDLLADRAESTGLLIDERLPHFPDFSAPS